MNPDRLGVGRPLPCHPAVEPVTQGFRAICPACGSLWDREWCGEEFAYTDAYPSGRMHHDPLIGRLKIATLRRWVAELGLEPRGHVVCEVGFGGGACLAYLHGLAQNVFGIEAVPANIAHARALGLPADHLCLFDERPATLSMPVSLWLFQDSFEHLAEPERFLPWVVANSAEGALLLLVAPDAASPSQRLLGRWWPHRLPDHAFHWSARGLCAFMERFGFRLRRRFSPVKRVSTAMLLTHLERTALRRVGRLLRYVCPAVTFWFNVGEMGLLFERSAR